MEEDFVLVRTRFRSFDLEIDVEAAVWCLETVQELLIADDSKVFCRKYRGSNIVLLIDKFTNKKGVFLKITKLFNGTLKNIIVPGGRSKWGWSRLVSCLDNLVGKRFWRSKGVGWKGGHFNVKSGDLDRKRFHKDLLNWDKTKCKWSYVGSSRGEEHQDSNNRRNWREVVLVFRFSYLQSWSSIKSALSKLLHFHHDLIPLVVDRVALWCANAEDI